MEGMRAFLLAPLLALLWACGQSEDPAQGAASLRIVPDTIQLRTKELLQLHVQAQDAAGRPVRAPSKLHWRSSAPEVALVFADGHVRGERPGEATITVTHGALVATAQVVVEPLPITELLIPRFFIQLTVGAETTVEAIPIDAGGYPRHEVPVTWRSLNETIATVDAAGTVVGRAIGSTALFASAQGVDGLVTVEVVRPPVARLVLSGTAEAIVGESVRLQLDAYDAQGNLLSLEADDVNWNSSVPEVASVDRTGLVTAHTPGRVTITADVEEFRAALGFASLTRPDRLELSSPSDTLWFGEQVALQLDVLDDMGNRVFDWPVHWSSSDADVLSVNRHGMVSVFGEGSATITAKVAELSASVELSAERLRLETFELGRWTDCGLTTAGAVVCRRDLPWSDGIRSTPRLTRWEVPHTFRALSVGEGHLCALTVEDIAVCVGENDFGQLGDGTREDSLLPREVEALRFRSISAGQLYTCGLTTSDEALCWGYNGDGRLGDGSFDDSPLPTPVASIGQPFVQVVTGTLGTTCGVAEDGTGHCWGDNRDGQLLDKTYRASPFPLQIPKATFSSIARPQGTPPFTWYRGDEASARLARFPDPWVAQVHLCGLAPDGAALCWGSNEQAQLGDGTLNRRDEPYPVAFPASFQSIHTDAGLYEDQASSCGLSDQGKVVCWGAFWDLDPGDLPLDPQLLFSSSTFRHLTIGVYRGCAIEEAGLAFCWDGDGWIELLPGQVTLTD